MRVPLQRLSQLGKLHGLGKASRVSSHLRGVHGLVQRTHCLRDAVRDKLLRRSHRIHLQLVHLFLEMLGVGNKHLTVLGSNEHLHLAGLYLGKILGREVVNDILTCPRNRLSNTKRKISRDEQIVTTSYQSGVSSSAERWRRVSPTLAGS